MSVIYTGYVQGAVASIPAALIASAVVAVRGWPVVRDGSSGQIATWANLDLHLGAWSRPAAVLVALAITVLAGGAAGVLRARFGCRLWQQVTGYVLAGLWFMLLFANVLPIDVAGSAEILAVCTVFVLAVVVRWQGSRSLLVDST
jgi:hypothetical protein